MRQNGGRPRKFDHYFDESRQNNVIDYFSHWLALTHLQSQNVVGYVFSYIWRIMWQHVYYVEKLDASIARERTSGVREI